MVQTAIDALGLSSILTDKLMSFDVVKKGKTGLTDQIILSCLMTDIHKPELKTEMGTYIYDHMTEEERLLIHRIYTKAKERVQEVDEFLSGKGEV